MATWTNFAMCFQFIIRQNPSRWHGKQHPSSHLTGLKITQFSDGLVWKCVYYVRSNENEVVAISVPADYWPLCNFCLTRQTYAYQVLAAKHSRDKQIREKMFIIFERCVLSYSLWYILLGVSVHGNTISDIIIEKWLEDIRAYLSPTFETALHHIKYAEIRRLG